RLGNRAPSASWAALRDDDEPSPSPVTTQRGCWRASVAIATCGPNCVKKRAAWGSPLVDNRTGREAYLNGGRPGLIPVGILIHTSLRMAEDVRMIMSRLTAGLLAGVGLAVVAMAPASAQDVEQTYKQYQSAIFAKELCTNKDFGQDEFNKLGAAVDKKV